MQLGCVNAAVSVALALMANVSREATRQHMQDVARMWLLGSGVSAIHKATGVARTTIDRWMAGDPQFLAIMEAAKQAIGRETAGHLVGLLPAAFRTIAKAIDGGDAKIAMQLLVASGALQSGGRVVGMSANGPKDGNGSGITIQVNLAQDDQPKKADVDVKAVPYSA